MNILYHHRTQGRGVEGVHIEEIVKALECLGNNVDIVSPYGKNNSKNRNEVSPKIYNFISKFSPEIFFELLEIFYNLNAYKNISGLLRKDKYGLIYERYAIFNWAGIKAARKFKIPIILEVNYTSFTPLYRKRSKMLKPLANWLEKKIFSEADGIVVVSTFLKSHLIDLGVDGGKVIVLPNAADPIKFNANLSGRLIRERYDLNNKKVIGFIGGFYPWHGLDMLIDCFADLQKEFQDLILLLIGDGPIKEKLENKVKKLNMEKNIRFTGRIDHGQLPDYMAAFDIAVMPDSNDYGSPMKIYEYMSMAKPVVAPRLGPLEDGISHGREGLLFNQSDRNGLTEAIKILLSDEKVRERIGRTAREKILSKHTWQKNAEGVLGLYRKVIGKN